MSAGRGGLLRAVEAPDFRLLFESAPGLYLVLTPELTIVAVSDNYLTATATRRDAILGRNLFEVFPDNPEDPHATGTANLRASLERVLATRSPDSMAVQKYDIRLPAGGFEERYWSPRNSPVAGPDGAVRWIIHRVEDVTEFVRLRQNHTELGRLNEELQSRAGEMEAEIYRRAQELEDANTQLRALHANLEKRVEERTQALASAEERLRQSQKLEAVGRLAGGVAHDFNNLLTVILSCCQEGLATLAPDAPLRVELTEIERAGQRAADLTRQMLAFSRQQVLQPRVLDVNEVLRTVGRMLQRVLGEDVELQVRPTPGVSNVRMDPGQLEQVLMNLVINARDAMPNGGKLTLETATVYLDDSYARQHPEVTAGHYTRLVVTDTGHGMDRATQQRLFEPFFTTKPRGKGTGLGLSTVFGIIKQSGGHIWVYSEVGQGTTFKIYLPAVEAPASIQAAPAAPRKNPNGTETILLAEDDDQIRAVADRVLRRAGYTVLVCASPQAALELCRDAARQVDLLLTDVVMPGLSGPRLAHEVVALRPSLRVLFMSGYPDDAVFEKGVETSRLAFLQKPLTPSLLLERVRQVLDGPPPPPGAL